MRPGLRDETIRRIEQATGRLATQSVARMDERAAVVPRAAGRPALLGHARRPGRPAVLRRLAALRPTTSCALTGEVFAAAPQAMARSVTLQQTVELVRQTIAVAEEHLPALAGADDADVVREELLRFSREIAFAAARVYAQAAETRGVVGRAARGAGHRQPRHAARIVGDPLPSQLAALGWHAAGPIGGGRRRRPRTAPPRDVLAEVHARDRAGSGSTRWPACTAHRLVVVFGGAARPAGRRRDAAAAACSAPGPVVVGPVAADIGRRRARHPGGAERAAGGAGVARRAAAGQRRRAAARTGARRRRRGPRAAASRPSTGRWSSRGDVLVETVSAFLDAGGALEATARALFVHANTVRYRLRRVAEVCGEAPTDAARRVHPAGRAGARPARPTTCELTRQDESTTVRPANRGHLAVRHLWDTYKAARRTLSVSRSPPIGAGRGIVDSVIAVFAPGQGAQTPGMLAPVARAARRRRAARPSSARPPASTCVRLGTTADADEIKDTAVTQPLLVALGVHRRRPARPRRRRRARRRRAQRRRAHRRRGRRGARPPAEAVAFAARRGAEMAAACALTPTGMSAVLGGDADAGGRRASRPPD